MVTVARCAEDVRRLTTQEDYVRELGVTVPVHVIPPHVDTDLIYPLPRPTDRPPTVLYSGAFARKQGLEVVLDMAAILRTRVPEAQVVLRGGVAYVPRLIPVAEDFNRDLHDPVAKAHHQRRVLLVFRIDEAVALLLLQRHVDDHRIRIQLANQ